ncbi:MAG: H-NS family nucleoid-associated regulatory protein [Lonepinella koalarum]|nr:H-NS family nucleoid-associated regulatory protein [Lonepinella koalarum]
MSDLIKLLKNARSLRAAVNALTLEDAKNVLTKLQEFIAQKVENEQAALEQEKARKELIEKYRSELKEKGITLEELGLTSKDFKEKKARKQRKPSEPKYKYIDENGTEKYWSGQGRIPTVIKVALAAGKTLESFKI